MAPRAQDNVQKLLQAEERRNKIVADAKARKQQKVKAAKNDAERDVGDFRKEKDNEFEQFRAQQLGGAQSESIDIERDTDRQMADMKKLAAQRLDKVAQMMADLVVITGKK
jgi:V-type H+-transporting ATPase subunit G